MGSKYLVDTEWLERHLDDADLRIFDCTVHRWIDEEGIFCIARGDAEYGEGKKGNQVKNETESHYQQPPLSLQALPPMRMLSSHAPTVPLRPPLSRPHHRLRPNAIDRQILVIVEFRPRAFVQASDERQFAEQKQ